MVIFVKWIEIKNLKNQIQRTSRPRQLIYENWDRIITMIARKISIEIIAKEIGVSRRTLFRVLSELNISTKDIIEAYENYRKAKEQKLIARMEKVKAPPTDYEQFKTLPIIKEFEKYCVSRRRISKKVVSKYVSILYRTCKELMVHPEELSKEVIEKYLDNLISSLGELIREESYAQAVSNIISVFRTWGDFRGFNIAHKTTEYSGIWSVYFDLEDRRNLVKLAYEILNKEDADFVTTMMEFYFRTGCRAKAITTIFDIKEHDRKVELWVKEKGKKKEYTWKKFIPKELWVRVRKYLPMTEKKLAKLRRLLVKLYCRYFNIDKELANKVIKATLFGVYHYRAKLNGKYIEKIIETPLTSEVLKELQERVGIERARLVYYALRHCIHIWRHTFAISMLEATNYNYEVVAVLGGWVKVNVLERVYGKLEYDRAYQIAFGEFKPKPFRFI